MVLENTSISHVNERGDIIDCIEKPMKAIAVAIIGWPQLRDCSPLSAGASQGHPSIAIVTPPMIFVNTK